MFALQCVIKSSKWTIRRERVNGRVENGYKWDRKVVGCGCELLAEENILKRRGCIEEESQGSGGSGKG